MNNKSSIGVDVRLAYLLIYLIPFLGSFLFLIFDYNNKTVRRHCLMSLFALIGVILINMVLFFPGENPGDRRDLLHSDCGALYPLRHHYDHRHGPGDEW